MKKKADKTKTVGDLIREQVSIYEGQSPQFEEVGRQIGERVENVSERLSKSLKIVLENTIKKNDSGAIKNENTIFYDRKDACLIKYLGNKKLTYELAEAGKRKQLFELLLNRGAYIQTDELQKKLLCPSSQAVSKLVQTFNNVVGEKLRLDNLKVIKGKKGSGYKINPELRIEKE